MGAGAIVAGAYFGDKLSPLSDTTNIASVATGVNLFTHIRHLMWTTVPAFLVSAVVYTVFGIQSHGGAVPEKVGTILSTLDAAFNWNILLLVPVIVVLGGSIWKKPTIPVMLVSAACAMINAVVFEHVSFKNAVVAGVNGFEVDMVGKAGFDASAVIEDVSRLLNRGGMNSMMSVLLICFCAISFAGVVSVSGSLDVLISRVLKPVRSTFGLILATIATGLATIGITSNGQVSLLIPGEMLRDEYVRRSLHPKNLSRTIEDAATVWEPILPWTSAGAYMAGTLGVATLSYMPWAVSNWIAIFFAMLWGATGIGIARLSSQERERMLAEGWIIGLISDQDPSLRDGIIIDFFGQETNAFTGAASIGRFRSVPIFPVFMHREPNGHHVLLVEPAIRAPKTEDKEADIRQTTQYVNDRIEAWVRKYPEEWFWLHDRWKSIRERST